MLKLLLCSLFVCSLAYTQGGPAYHLGSGPSLPSTCSPLSGDVFILTSGSTGTLYTCTTINTWAPFLPGTGNGDGVRLWDWYPSKSSL